MNTIQSHWEVLKTTALLSHKSEKEIEEMKLVFYGGAIAFSKIIRGLGNDLMDKKISQNAVVGIAQGLNKELDDYVRALCKEMGIL